MKENCNNKEIGKSNFSLLCAFPVIDAKDGKGIICHAKNIS